MYLPQLSPHLWEVLPMMFYTHDTNGRERKEEKRGGSREINWLIWLTDYFSKHKQWRNLTHFKRQSSYVISAFWKFYYSFWAIFIKRWIKVSWNKTEKNVEVNKRQWSSLYPLRLRLTAYVHKLQVKSESAYRWEIKGDTHNPE